jgi:hypothetical protein
LKLVANIELLEASSSDQGYPQPNQYQFLLLFFDGHFISKLIYFNLKQNDKCFAQMGCVIVYHYSIELFSGFIDQNYLLFLIEVMVLLMNFR